MNQTAWITIAILAFDAIVVVVANRWARRRDDAQ